jgi:hypothetical protein
MAANDKPKEFVLRIYENAHNKSAFTSCVVWCAPSTAKDLQRLFNTRLSAPFLLVAADTCKNYPKATKRRAEIPNSEDDETTTDEKNTDSNNRCVDCGGSGIGPEGSPCESCGGTGEAREDHSNEDPLDDSDDDDDDDDD